jgi:superfamily I DNA/RNA helicase
VTTSEYEEFETKRSGYSQLVLDSSTSKKIVMAGPGTGKSYLFQQIAKNLISTGKTKILVLTFINELVKDLSVDMHSLAEVSTLHSFAAKELRNNQVIYMDLLKVVSKDLKDEQSVSKELDKILHNLEYTESAAIEYLAKRSKYYKSYDPSSIVFELVKHYTANPSQIPEYDLVLVDEYQDFNLLEAELIRLLATKSNVLIAGDDDQSLYSFKHARPDNIRAIQSASEYESFELPYCSRSTEVVIDAFHDCVNKAQADGFLGSRVSKQYLYFPTQKKDAISGKHPAIEIKKSVFYAKNAYYIDQAIANIFKDEPVFDVLVICSLKSQISPLAKALRKKGYSNVSGDDGEKDKCKLLLQGLNLLVKDKDSNLAWRLCLEGLASESDLKDAIIKSKDCDKAFSLCVSSTQKSEIKNLRAACIKIEKNHALTNAQRELVFEKLSIDPRQLGELNAKERVFSDKYNAVHHSAKVKITTILGSKGLSYDYVFMVNFDDQYLIPNGVDDESISKFLVALTRSKKKIHIFTSKTTEPKFVSWIDSSRKNIT